MPGFRKSRPSYLGVEHVFIPKMAYNGQKPKKLTARKIPPNTITPTPAKPVTIPDMYNPEATTASTTRISRSTVPMFFFIISDNLSTPST